jgi:hypothetical protein
MRAISASVRGLYCPPSGPDAPALVLGQWRRAERDARRTAAATAAAFPCTIDFGSHIRTLSDFGS